MSHCTCRIVQTKTIVSYPLTVGDFAIDWCDLHLAAPTMVEALKLVSRTVEKAISTGLIPQSHATSFRHVLDEARKTIVAAEGR